MAYDLSKLKPYIKGNLPKIDESPLQFISTELGTVSASIRQTIDALRGVAADVAATVVSIAANTADILTKAPLASPALTGTPTAPTASLGTNTTQLATTAFALANAGVTTIAGNTGAFTLSGGLTNSTNAVKRAYNEAVSQTNPTNPAGTTSTTPVMAGLALSITPATSTRVLAQIHGQLSSSLAGAYAAAALRYGTGAAPTNGAAATGTAIGSTPAGHSATGAYSLPFTVGGVITGLTPGTTYWVDLAMISSSASSGANYSALCATLLEV